MPEFNDWFPGSPHGAAHVNVKGFGAIGDGIEHTMTSLGYANLAAAQVDYPKVTQMSDTADWAGIQTAIDYALENDIYTVLIPNGRYITNDTIHVCYGFIDGTPNATGVMLTGPGFAPLAVPSGHLMPGAWIYPNFKDRPVINVQGVRKGGVRHLGIMGPATMLDPAGQGLNWRANKANYIQTGSVDAKYAPFCGVAIDGYTGWAPLYEAPVPAYPTPRYSAYSGTPANPYTAGKSSEWFVEECYIAHTNLGIICQPWGGGNGDFGKMRGNQIEYQKIAFSIPNSQARSQDYQNCNIYGVHTVFNNTGYGNGIGNLQGNFTNIHFGQTYRLIHGLGTWSHPLHFVECYGEQNMILGDFNGCKVSFESCLFSSNDAFYNAGSTAITEWRNEPMYYGQAEFKNCHFFNRNVYHFIGKSTFHNCLFAGPEGPTFQVGLTAPTKKALTACGGVFISMSHADQMGPSPFSGSVYLYSRTAASGGDFWAGSDPYNGFSGYSLWGVGQKDDSYAYEYDMRPMQLVDNCAADSASALTGITRTINSATLGGATHEVGDIVYFYNYAFYVVQSIAGNILTLNAITHFKAEGSPLVYSMLTLYGEEGDPTNPPIDYSTSNTIHYFPIGALDFVPYTSSSDGVFLKTDATTSPTVVKIVDYAGNPVATMPTGLSTTSKLFFHSLNTKMSANTMPFPKWTIISSIDSGAAKTITMSQPALVSGTWAYGPGIKRLK